MDNVVKFRDPEDSKLENTQKAFDMLDKAKSPIPSERKSGSIENPFMKQNLDPKPTLNLNKSQNLNPSNRPSLLLKKAVPKHGSFLNQASMLNNKDHLKDQIKINKQNEKKLSM